MKVKAMNAKEINPSWQHFVFKSPKLGLLARFLTSYLKWYLSQFQACEKETNVITINKDLIETLYGKFSSL